MEFLFANQIASIEALIIFLCLFIIIGIFLVDFYIWIIRVIGVLTPRKQYIQEAQKVAEDHPNLMEAMSEKNEVIEEYLASKKSEEIPTIESENNDTNSAEPILSGIDESSPYIDLINELPSENPVVNPSENTLELANVSVIEDIATESPGEDISAIKDELTVDEKDTEVHYIENGEVNFTLSAGNDIEALEEARKVIDSQGETSAPTLMEETASLLPNNAASEPNDLPQIDNKEELEEIRTETIEAPTLSENITGDSSEEILPLNTEKGEINTIQEIAEEVQNEISQVEEIILSSGIVDEEKPKEVIPETIEAPITSIVDTVSETIEPIEEKTETILETPEQAKTTEVISEIINKEVDDEIIEGITEEIPPEIQEDESFIGKDLSTQDSHKEEPKKPIAAVQPISTFNQASQSPTGISPEKREKLSEIVNTVKTLVARGHFIEARGMIINGLSFHKDNRDLNILLAELYVRDRDYPKAEYIFKDMARIYPEDAELLGHLASNLAIQRKYDVSYELYKKILSLSGATEDLLYTLTHLASELGLQEDAYTYARAYLHQYPKSPEILWLMAQSQIAMNERKFAIETLIKLKNLTPYNQEIVDLIQKLVMEQELAGNFGEEK